MTVYSFTQLGKEYEVTVENGQAIDCTCADRYYRKHTCKHMSNAQAQIDSEVTRALRFLEVKKQIASIGNAPKYSEVCGHLVRRDVRRHCGCMA